MSSVELRPVPYPLSNHKFNGWVFKSMVVIGPISECRKWIDLVQTHMSYSSFHPQTCGFANFEDSNLVSLRRMAAHKILEKYRTFGLQKSDIEYLPLELLAKIVEQVPLVVPTSQPTEKNIAIAPFELNFEERDTFIKIIKSFKSDLDDSFGSQFDKREGMLYFSFKKGHWLPSADEVQSILKENNIHVTIVARDSCDWDNNENNRYTKLFVIENGQFVFGREDLPQRIELTDHPLIHKYGHLLKGHREIWNERRTEFTSETLGEFKQFWRPSKIPP